MGLKPLSSVENAYALTQASQCFNDVLTRILDELGREEPPWRLVQAIWAHRYASSDNVEQGEDRFAPGNAYLVGTTTGLELPFQGFYRQLDGPLARISHVSR